MDHFIDHSTQFPFLFVRNRRVISILVFEGDKSVPFRNRVPSRRVPSKFHNGLLCRTLGHRNGDGDGVRRDR